MAIPTAAIVGVVGVIVALPPTAHVIWVMTYRASQSSYDEGAIIFCSEIATICTDHCDVERQLEPRRAQDTAPPADNPSALSSLQEIEANTTSLDHTLEVPQTS